MDWLLFNKFLTAIYIEKRYLAARIDTGFYLSILKARPTWLYINNGLPLALVY
jgi:hypothetical protein